jgi:hypothetical protein
MFNFTNKMNSTSKPSEVTGQLIQSDSGISCNIGFIGFSFVFQLSKSSILEPQTWDLKNGLIFTINQTILLTQSTSCYGIFCPEFVNLIFFDKNSQVLGSIISSGIDTTIIGGGNGQWKSSIPQKSELTGTLTHSNLGIQLVLQYNNFTFNLQTDLSPPALSKLGSWTLQKAELYTIDQMKFLLNAVVCFGIFCPEFSNMIFFDKNNTIIGTIFASGIDYTWVGSGTGQWKS